MKNLFCHRSIRGKQITTKFSTCHDSTAVGACAKFSSNRFIRIGMMAKLKLPSNLNNGGRIVSETGPRFSLYSQFYTNSWWTDHWITPARSIAHVHAVVDGSESHDFNIQGNSSWTSHTKESLCTIPQYHRDRLYPRHNEASWHNNKAFPYKKNRLRQGREQTRAFEFIYTFI